MKIYITASFGRSGREYIETLCSLVKEAGFVDFCFIRDVENYEKVFHDPHELMLRAKEEIGKCDALLMEYDGPGHGRMVELGMAYAMGKRIVLITKKGTSVKETVEGVSHGIVEYEDLADIVEPLSNLLADWE